VVWRRAVPGIKASKARKQIGVNQGKFLLRRFGSFLIVVVAMTASAGAGLSAADAAEGRTLKAAASAASDDASSSPSSSETTSSEKTTSVKQEQQNSTAGDISTYEGKLVLSIQLPGVLDREREHILELLPQKVGQGLNRDQVRDSIRTLFATGRFGDIQAEVEQSGDAVVLIFSTSPNFFIGAIDVEGAPNRPSSNQIINASKFQLGELHTLDKLDRALKNIRQLMQENGYYNARVTAESTSNTTTQQVSILFHVTAGEQAHVGQVKVTGSGSFSQGQVQDIAKMHPGERVTAARVSGSLQRLRKKFQKQQRVLAQVSISEQTYHAESNSVDYTFQIEPGPVVVVYAQGFHISRGVMRKEIPVYEEDALDDDLLNEGKRNLLDYLQTRGHFDAAVEIKKESDARTLRVIYEIDPGPLHHLSLIEISGLSKKSYFRTEEIRSRLQIQPSTRFLSHGRYSGVLLKSDVATLESLYRSNGFRQAKIETKVDDNYKGSDNNLAVHIHIDEGPQTKVGEFQMAGNQSIPREQFTELETEPGQPYSEDKLAADRERILNLYFNRGFPNATLDIGSVASTQPNRQDVTYTIREGERFRVDQVMIGGLEHTQNYVVEREVQVHAKDPLSQQDLLDTQTRLYNLGIFSQVDTAVQNPEGSDPQKNVLVQVQEAKRYTFTYGVGLEFQTGQPAGSNAPQGETGVSPRVGFDVTRLNFLGRNETITFQSHVGRLQQRGLVSYEIPKLFDSEKFKLIFTIFYDNSLDVSTFTSQRLEGKVDLRQQISKPSSIVYRFDYRRVRASNFATDFSPSEIQLLSLPARVGGPGFTYIRDKRDNPLESTKGNYFTLDASAASSYFGSQADFGRVLGQNSTYYILGKGKPGHQFVFARSTTIGMEQPFRGTKVLAPGSCPLNSAGEPTCSDISTIPLPELFFAGGGNSHRGFGLNQAGPRDPDSGFPIGGSAMFVNSLELRFPPISLPYLGDGYGFAIFHDMGNVYTAGHDMIKGVLRWHQPNLEQCLQFTNSSASAYNNCVTNFNNSGYDYTAHALGVGVRYKTPIGPLRFDFGYNLNPTAYPTGFTLNTTQTPPFTGFTPERLRHFNVFFSIGQPF
jgi:outer membrane protein insertion porin family